PGFKSDRSSFWEFAAHPTPGNPLPCFVQLRFASPTISIIGMRVGTNIESLVDILHFFARFLLMARRSSKVSILPGKHFY
ncbi:hypothetical protein, partial [Burkholderia ambifaria]|uniref:hypothetical protein n=1 Tax=Burkholderia ambifaria TaxID=152480 RepID=UPI001ABA8795